ncbi:hypothetical protein OLL83_003847 [Shewanella algae]|uniref:DUF2335 domain-containing protein n=2 Tax=Shewanella TaxID=22 RepID=UPI00222F02A2|nr:DUF2335 domain-containing protein [Shewanella algae]UZD58006.1 hypothetical protein OLL83_003847 [Shewanella algae]
MTSQEKSSQETEDLQLSVNNETSKIEDEESVDGVSVPDIEDIEGVLERIEQQSPTDAKKVRQFIAIQQEHHSGPMPRPADLAAYGDVQADLPNRIMAMAEKSLNERSSYQREILSLKSKELDVSSMMHLREVIHESIRLIFTFIIVLFCIGGSFYMAMNDHETIAGIIGGTTVVGIVGSFLRKKASSNENAKSDDKEKE